jgi:hypothetical protein
VVSAPFNDLFQNGFVDLLCVRVSEFSEPLGSTDVLNRNRFGGRSFSQVVDHVLEEDGALDDIAIFNKRQ